MPTQSKEIQSPEAAVQGREWAARTDGPKRSIFGNFRSQDAPLSGMARSEMDRQRAASETSAPLQASIDLAVARSFIYRFLAKAYEDPTEEGWHWLCSQTTQQMLQAACNVAQCSMSAMVFPTNAFDPFLNAYLAAFGHAARGSCPLNEIEYGDIKADPLFQPHRLADLAAFYRAFGLEVASDAGERHDHICLELEFMCVLAAKEAYAREQQLDIAQLTQCRDAQKQFLREHLGRWAPAFARRLAAATGEPTLRGLAGLTRAFVESDCARFGVRPGSEELALRPVDETADRLCDACGLSNLPPGALAAT